MGPAFLRMIRHGMSEYNEAIRESDDEYFRNKFTVDTEVNVSASGIADAQAKASVYQSRYDERFDVCFASRAKRTHQTAEIFGYMPDLCTAMIAERSIGEAYTALPPSRRWDAVKAGFKDDPYRYRPPGGQSMEDVCTVQWEEFSHYLESLHRDEYAIMIGHGDNIRGKLINMLDLTGDEFNALWKVKDPMVTVQNCQMFDFTRIDPVTDECSADHLWFRTDTLDVKTLDKPSWRQIR